MAGVKEEVADVERHRGDDGPEARFLCRGEEAQLRRVAAHVDYRGHACGVAVDMGGAVAGAGDAQVGGAEGLDDGVLAHEAHQHVYAHESLLEKISGMDHGDIQLAVGNRSVRGYEGVVAVLRRIADNNQEGPVGDSLAVDLQYIVLGREAHVLVDGAAEVGHQASTPAAGEALADGRIEAHAEGAEEGRAVGAAVVGGYDVAPGDDFERAAHVDRNSEMARQAVAAAAGYDAQRCVGADKPAGGLVDGTVASTREHTGIGAVGRRGRRDFRCMARTLGMAHVDVQTYPLQIAHHFRHDAVFAHRAGSGVDYQYNFLSHGEGRKGYGRRAYLSSEVSENSIR